ncbi:MAG: hypothetical protein WD991_00410 [Candidatus Paceibacterota bacterium]
MLFKRLAEAGRAEQEQKFCRILCVCFKSISGAASLLFACPIYNGQMSGKENNSKNFKDTLSGGDGLDMVIKDIAVSISYPKTNKLITALYMVTDIIDHDEPLRNKLRTLGVGIISDIYGDPACAVGKISEVLSFLGIARTLHIVSEMNCDILEVEFTKLAESIRDSADTKEQAGEMVDLSEFFQKNNEIGDGRLGKLFSSPRMIPHGYPGKFSSIGQASATRIGLQKGSTLLKALSDKTRGLSDKSRHPKNSEHFDILKKERRAQIVSFIRHHGGSATITDIHTKAVGTLASCGEKTLQRELLSMQKDRVLKKTGEKRWSRYFLVS